MKIAPRDMHYLSKEDREQYEMIMAKECITDEDEEIIMGIVERMEHTIANMVEE